MSEIIIYHAYHLKEKARSIEIVSGFSLRFAGFLIKTAKVLAVAGLIFLIFSYGPSFWYFLKSGGSEAISALLQKTAAEQLVPEESSVGRIRKNLDYQPQLDSSLPLAPRLKIPTISVETALYEAPFANYQEVLKKGVWRVPDFGTPAQREKPTILAAHRFGYLAWSNSFRRHNSFFNLPKLKIGDTVEIDWKQRRYVYEVYGEDRGEEIKDYSADLILYTCEDLTSKIRIFKYARLLLI